MFGLTRSRLTLRIAPLGMLLMGARCEDEVAACARAPIQTLVFVDQSASNVVDAATKAMFSDTVAALVDNSLACKGDAVHGFLVHANTRGKVSRVDVVNAVDPADVAGKPKLARLKEETRFRGDSTALVDMARDRLPSLFTAQVEPRFRAHTDMLGTLEVISDELARADTNSTVRIYYLGDMHESMPAPRRDFDARKPRDPAEAEAWANADAALLQTMNVRRERFKNAEVRVLLGNLANKPGAPEVRRYWERLFQNAGFDAARVRYN